MDNEIILIVSRMKSNTPWVNQYPLSGFFFTPFQPFFKIRKFARTGKDTLLQYQKHSFVCCVSLYDIKKYIQID